MTSSLQEDQIVGNTIEECKEISNMPSHRAHEKGACQPLPQASLLGQKAKGVFNSKILCNNRGFKEEGMAYGHDATRKV